VKDLGLRIKELILVRTKDEQNIVDIVSIKSFTFAKVTVNKVVDIDKNKK